MFTALIKIGVWSEIEHPVGGSPGFTSKPREMAFV